MTPMLGTFDSLYAKDLSVDQKKSLAIGESMYNTLYQLKDSGLIDRLISSSSWDKLMGDVMKQKFTKDDNGAEFWDYFIESARKNVADQDVLVAINKFEATIKDLLRYESGAAISSSEWRSYFDIYMPSSTDSEKLAREKLSNWDARIFNALRQAGMQTSQYVPIFQ